MGESITVNYEGEEYTGYFEIIKVDKTTCSFNVTFKNDFHTDSSLFKHGSENQMKIHAKGVLRDMVKKHINGPTGT